MKRLEPQSSEGHLFHVAGPIPIPIPIVTTYEIAHFTAAAPPMSKLK